MMLWERESLKHESFIDIPLGLCADCVLRHSSMMHEIGVSRHEGTMFLQIDNFNPGI